MCVSDLAMVQDFSKWYSVTGFMVYRYRSDSITYRKVQYQYFIFKSETYIT